MNHFKDRGEFIEMSKNFFEELIKRPPPLKQEDDKSFKIKEYEEKTIVPCRVTMSQDLHILIKMSLLPDLHCSFEEFVTDRFMERMQQILMDSEKFDKLMLEPVLRSHAMLNNENELWQVVSVVRKDDQVIRKC